MDIIDPTASPHDAEAPPRLQGTNQDQPAPSRAFHEQIEHPVHAVIHINVDSSRRVALDERAGARPGKGVAGLVVQGEISFRLHDDARAFSPNKLGADELARTNQRVALKKRRTKRRCSSRHERLFRGRWRHRFVINRQRHTALDWLAITKSRNE